MYRNVFFIFLFEIDMKSIPRCLKRAVGDDEEVLKDKDVLFDGTSIVELFCIGCLTI